MALEQSDPRARALEKACDDAYAAYNAAAGVVAGLWKKVSKAVFLPETGKPVRTVDENNPSYPEFAVATLEKEEAYVEWQKRAHAHGEALHDVRK